jgi:hypothetical protein
MTTRKITHAGAAGTRRTTIPVKRTDADFLSVLRRDVSYYHIATESKYNGTSATGES